MSVEKKEDALMDCNTCGLRLICRKKTYPAYEDHPEKTVLQWQNEKGGAHYKWIGPEKFKCVDENGNTIPPKDQGSQPAPKIIPDYTSPNITPSKGRDNIKTDLQKIKDSENLDLITTELIQKDSILLWKVRRVVEETIKKLENEPHGGMIGQFTEIIWNKHFGEKRIE